MHRFVSKKVCLYCVDVGSNQAVFTIQMALHGCLVQSFEIQPDVLSSAVLTVQINELENMIHFYHCGLSDTPSAMSIEGTYGYAFIKPARSSSDKLVQIKTGDKCIAHRKHIALVKIDVEGVEVRTLLGMKRIIRSGSVEALHIDIGPNRWDRGNLTTDKGFEIMHSLLKDYQVHLVARRSGSCPTVIFSFNICTTFNIFISNIRKSLLPSPRKT